MFFEFALPVYQATVIIGWMKDEQEAILEHMDICAEDLSEVSSTAKLYVILSDMFLINWEKVSWLSFGMLLTIAP